jgi:hypothetical protein
VDTRFADLQDWSGQDPGASPDPLEMHRIASTKEADAVLCVVFVGKRRELNRVKRTRMAFIRNPHGTPRAPHM